MQFKSRPSFDYPDAIEVVDYLESRACVKQPFLSEAKGLSNLTVVSSSDDGNYMDLETALKFQQQQQCSPLSTSVEADADTEQREDVMYPAKRSPLSVSSTSASKEVYEGGSDTLVEYTSQSTTWESDSGCQHEPVLPSSSELEQSPIYHSTQRRSSGEQTMLAENHIADAQFDFPSHVSDSLDRLPLLVPTVYRGMTSKRKWYDYYKVRTPTCKKEARKVMNLMRVATDNPFNAVTVDLTTARSKQRGDDALANASSKALLMTSHQTHAVYGATASRRSLSELLAAAGVGNGDAEKKKNCCLKKCAYLRNCSQSADLWISHLLPHSSVLVTVLMIACIALGVVRIGYGSVPVWVCGLIAGAYAIYLFDNLCLSQTLHYLMQAAERRSTEQLIANLKTRPCTLWFKIECFHYESEMVATGGFGLEERRNKVVSHHSVRQFKYDEWFDRSSIVPNLGKFQLTRIDFKLDAFCANAYTKACYSRQMRQFIKENNRDTHYTITRGVSMEGFEPMILCDSSEMPVLSCMNWFWFVLFSFAGCSTCFRCCVEARAGRCHFQFIKEVRCRKERAVAL